MKLILSVIMLISTSTSFAWERDNDPKFINPYFSKNFNSLPTHGELTLDKMPWASSFWPHVYGGIAFRWNNYYSVRPSFANMHERVSAIDKEVEKLNKELFSASTSNYKREQLISKIESLKTEKINTDKAKSLHYKRYFFDMKRISSKEEAFSLTHDEISKLSATEKYDLYLGDYSMRLTNQVLTFTSPFDAYWEGVCNGWSSAAIEFHEPRPITVTNKDGLKISFGSSDLKALLSYYHASITANFFARRTLNTARVGRRCKTAFPKEAWFIQNGKEYYKSIKNGEVVINEVPADCVDTDPGAFHIVLTNMIGKMNEGFVAEVVRDNEIWNQPVYGYKTTIIEDNTTPRFNATEGTYRQVKVKTVMEYANDGGRMFWGAKDPEDEFYAWWDATNGTKNYRKGEKTFEYYIDLDAYGKIIGGMWLSYERPDFLWVKKSKGFIGNKYRYGIAGYLDDLKNLVEIR